VRRALGLLTGRGRTLAAVGALSFLVALSIGDRDLARLGLLLLVLPAGAVLSVGRARTHLSSERTLTSARVAVGGLLDVQIRLHNSARLRTGVLLAEDQVPPAFGGRPRFVVDRLGGGADVEVRYSIRCELRGRYRLGPLSVRLRDPFGLAETRRDFDDADDLVVTPVVRPLPAVRLSGEWAGLGASTRRSVASAGEDDAATREYRLGDDLRRIHWRSTAHRGELMVRREEQPWQSRAAVLLDTRALGHVGDGAGSSLEWAVSAAASISSHLDQLGFEQRLVYDSGQFLSGNRATGRWLDVLLDSLASCEPSRSLSLTQGFAALRYGGGEGLVVAIVATLQETDVEEMVRARGPGVASVAILLDTEGWRRGREHTPAAAQLLLAAGWRVVVAGRSADIAALWRQVGVEVGRGLGADAGGSRGVGDLHAVGR
jgi:uncharacterized protein (DUF58 family)